MHAVFVFTKVMYTAIQRFEPSKFLVYSVFFIGNYWKSYSIYCMAHKPRFPNTVVSSIS